MQLPSKYFLSAVTPFCKHSTVVGIIFRICQMWPATWSMKLFKPPLYPQSDICLQPVLHPLKKVTFTWCEIRKVQLVGKHHSTILGGLLPHKQGQLCAITQSSATHIWRYLRQIVSHRWASTSLNLSLLTIAPSEINSWCMMSYQSTKVLTS
jgi:hypothetical protein